MSLITLSDDFQVLVDCGMDMESPSETMPLYPGCAFPFDASRVNLVILTHAHLDHVGKIPNLIREGFEGKIVCTEATKALARLLLLDAAALNRKKLNAYHKKRTRIPDYQPKYAIEELYQERHVERVLKLVTTIPADEQVKVREGMYLNLVTAGHLLGAAHVHLSIRDGGKERRFLFSGDVGRKQYPLLACPKQPPEADILVCETTYGKRMHQSVQAAEEAIFEAIEGACIDKPGKLILPAFSIGRTQAILFTLNKLFRERDLPEIPVYADSPLAMQSNGVYERFSALLNAEALDFKNAHRSLFDFPQLHYILENSESKRISKLPERAIFVSSSGMLEGGRIQHHIRNHLHDPDCTIMMVGFSAEGTLGHRLMNANGTLEFDNKIMEVKATVLHTDAFSGHGDQEDLLQFVKAQSPEVCQNVFLVHGEPESMEAFQQLIAEHGFTNVKSPKKGEAFTF